MNMDDPSQNDELYPIAVLIDELKVRLSCSFILMALARGAASMLTRV